MGEFEDLLAEIKRLQESGRLPKSPTEEERISWAYGNVALSNPNVTLDMVREAARKLAEERSLSIRRPMRRPILIWPNSKLFFPSEPVSDVEMGMTEFKDLIADMFETMESAHGVGLAAVQVGVHLRLFVMKIEGRPRFVLINPTIDTLIGQKEPVEEGCLSMPGVVELVPRAPGVAVTFTDEQGVRCSEAFMGLEAQCVQHEIEHLYGITLAQGKGLAKRKIFKRTIQKTLERRGVR